MPWEPRGSAPPGDSVPREGREELPARLFPCAPLPCLPPAPHQLHHMVPYLPDTGRAVICVPAARGESRPAQQCHAKPEPSSLPGSEPGPAARAIHVSQGFGDNSLLRTCSTSHNPPVNNFCSPAEEVNYPGPSGRRLAPGDPKQSLKHLRLGAVQPFPKSLGGSPVPSSPF